MTRVRELLAGRYELEARIGAGGMGEVYRAHDRLLGRTVAVKLPAASVAQDPVARARFRREARAAARLNHPNVVDVYDWNEVDEGAYLVLEHVDGPSLRAVLAAEGSLDARTVARYGAQIADALACAHDHGVVHRDVKPSNVLVAADGSVRVTDFGIASAVPPDRSVDPVMRTLGDPITQPGTVIGSPGYLAPEQLAGAPIDGRSDIYSLGVLLGELLDGARPRGGDDAETTLAAISTPATRGLPPVPDDDSAGLRHVVARATADDPAARHQRAGDLRDELLAIADRLGTGREPADAEPEAVPPARARGGRHRPHRALRELPRVDRAAGRPPRGGRAHPPRPRRWRVRHVVTIVLPVVLAGAAVAVAISALDAAPTKVAVPDVVDRDVFTAAALIQEAGLNAESRVIDTPRAGGYVISQRPAGARQLAEGSAVRITVSNVHATVPPVVGFDSTDATVALTAQGFTSVTQVMRDTEDESPGTVLGVSPVEGDRARKDRPVALTIARDPWVELDDLSGRSESDATAVLVTEGLDVRVETESDRSSVAGTVLETRPRAGRTVRRGSEVTIVVSSGPRSVVVPPTATFDADDAVDTLEDAGFAVVVSTTPSSRPDRGTVLSQDPAGGYAPEGSTVRLVVGAG